MAWWVSKTRPTLRETGPQRGHGHRMYADFNFWVTLLIIVVVMGVIQGACAYLVLLERKIAAWTQDRLGPNRVGPFGLLQPIADGLKFVFKEQLVPSRVDKLFYFVAPAVSM